MQEEINTKTTLEKFAYDLGTEVAKLAEKIKTLQNSEGGSTTQDTGWRRVPSDNLKQGFLTFRRVGNMVSIGATGGNWGTVSVKKNNERPAYTGNNDNKILLLAANSLPEGFRPKTSTYGSVFYDNGDYFGMIYVHSPEDSSTISIRGVNKLGAQGNANHLRVSTVTYISDDPFPSKPIGTPL